MTDRYERIRDALATWPFLGQTAKKLNAAQQ